MNASILIADENVERAERIASACTERGFECRVVPHGAAALEAALAAPPDVLIARRDLALIEGDRLGEILQANPRTQSLQVLFLEDGTTSPTSEDPFQAIGASASPHDVAETVRALLEERQVDQEADEPAADELGGGVRGELAQLSLGDLLQLFHVSRKTGIVELERPGDGEQREAGQVILTAGEVIHAVAGSITGEKALFRLIAWKRGSFEFRPEVVSAETTIQKPTLALLREGRRFAEEWERLAKRLPAMESHVTLKLHGSSLPKVMHPLTQEVLIALEHYSSVRDVVDHCSHPDYQVLRMLRTLIRRGIVVLRRGVPGPGGTPSQAGLFSPGQASRLRDSLRFEGPNGGGPSDAKLVVASANPESCREFMRVMSRLPGFELAESLQTGEVPQDVIVSLGRIAVDTEVGIEFIMVPVGKSFRPLRSVAADGAIGVLLLLSGPISVAVDAIRPIADEMRDLPHARIFHLLLLEKGQGLAPEILRENLSLLDAGSLFLVPQEDQAKARILLREMFARILP